MHIGANYEGIRKRSLVALFTTLLSVVGLMFLALWVYAHSEPVLIVVQMLLSVCLMFMYVYMKETLTFYMCKFIRQNPGRVRDVIPDKDNEAYMLKYEYPMREVVMCDRMKLTDYFVAHCYLLEGNAKVF